MSHGDLDALVRRGLTEAADPLDDLDTTVALERVLSRSKGRRRTRRAVVAVAVAAVVGAVGFGSTALVTGLRDETDGPGPALRPHGAYQRTVDTAPWQGRWTMQLGGDRVLVLRAPAGVPGDDAPTDGASYVLDAGTLRLDAFTNGACTETPPGTYTWSVKGDGLVLLPVDEQCAARELVFAGTWRSLP